jgi:hypothetical protein
VLRIITLAGAYVPEQVGCACAVSYMSCHAPCNASRQVPHALIFLIGNTPELHAYVLLCVSCALCHVVSLHHCPGRSRNTCNTRAPPPPLATRRIACSTRCSGRARAATTRSHKCVCVMSCARTIMFLCVRNAHVMVMMTHVRTGRSVVHWRVRRSARRAAGTTT